MHTAPRHQFRVNMAIAEAVANADECHSCAQHTISALDRAPKRLIVRPLIFADAGRDDQRHQSIRQLARHRQRHHAPMWV